MQRFQRILLSLLLGLTLVGLVIQMGCDIASELGPEGGYTKAQVERGRYLVMNVSLCWECHTPFGPTGPDMERLLAGGREFIPGALSTPNLTPDPETGIGKWTDQQIFTAITKGIGHFDDEPEGEPLFPIMPYYQFANMTPEDVTSIIAFLRSVKPIKNEVPERALPFPVPPPAKPLNYSSLPGANDDPGKYLTSAAGVCLECHTRRVNPQDPASLDSTKYFAGGEEFPIPGLKVASANLTSDKETGIGNWTRQQIITALREGKNPKGEPLCPPMPQFKDLTGGDIDAIVNFIRNLPPIKNKVEECELVEGPPPAP